MVDEVLNKQKLDSENRKIIEKNLLILFLICHYDEDSFKILLKNDQKKDNLFDLKTLVLKGI